MTERDLMESKRFWVQFATGLVLHLIAVLVALVMTYAGIDKRLTLIETKTSDFATKQYVDGAMAGSSADRMLIHAKIDQLEREMNDLESDKRSGYR